MKAGDEQEKTGLPGIICTKIRNQVYLYAMVHMHKIRLIMSPFPMQNMLAPSLSSISLVLIFPMHSKQLPPNYFLNFLNPMF